MRYLTKLRLSFSGLFLGSTFHVQRSAARFFAHLHLGRVGGVIFILFLLPLNQVLAQNSSISGIVTDPEAQTVAGATVFVKGTSNGTTTGADGKYALTNVKERDTIVFTYVGMTTQEVAFVNQATINAVLQYSNTQLSEFAVLGYGRQKIKDVTGAVAVVGSKDLDARPATQIGSLLNGKAAGVVINPGSGKPGSGISINIRGIGSTGGSEPLYVVDGVPVGSLRNLNPTDVESITVLKDASSAAIYGAQGASGVILVTTKSGTSEKPVISFNTYGGYSEIIKRYDLLNADQYQDMMTDLGYNTNWTKFTEDRDWQDEVFQQGLSQNYQLSVAGKSNKTNYYISGSWLNESGAIKSNEIRRTNFKLNLDQRVNRWLKLGTRISYSNFNDIDINDTEVLEGALRTPPVIGVYNDRGQFTTNPFQDWENPRSITDGRERSFDNRNFLGNAYAEITFLKHFTFKSNIGIEQSSSVDRFFLDPFRTGYGRSTNGRAYMRSDQYNYMIIDNTLTYKKGFGAHEVEALVGTIEQSYRWEDQTLESIGFSGDKVKAAGAGSSVVGYGSGVSEKRNISYISRVNYAFDNKYLLTVNFRRDGSSVFGPDQRYGNFYAGSIGWRISQEKFLQNINWLNDAKIRVGWGLNGNDPIAPYSYLGIANSGSRYIVFEGKDASGADTVIYATGIHPGRLENRNLKWEETQQFNVGIDVSLFNGRVSSSIDIYDKQSKDVLIGNIPLPRTSGFNSAAGNAASLQNRGLEISVSTVNLVNKVNWRTDFNVSFNRNKVLDFKETKDFGGNINGENTAITQEGLPFAQFFGYIFEGVDPQNGRAQYLNSENGLTYTPRPEDRRIIGDPHPDFTYGITNTFSYKGFGLSIFLQGSQGNDIVNANRFAYLEDMAGPGNQSTAVLRRWQNPGDVTDVPGVFQAGSDATTLNHLFSSRFVEDGSYMRIKALTLSYDVPTTSRLMSKNRIENLRFYATGENLLTFTNYSGLDPEVNRYGSTPYSRGLDNVIYPQLRKIIFGLSLNF
jgi:TonB-dependent starch-binding outer membrane protein SusC